MKPADAAQVDIVGRLRWHAMARSNHYTSLTREAADEIERLRRELEMADVAYRSLAEPGIR